MEIAHLKIVSVRRFHSILRCTCASSALSAGIPSDNNIVAQRMALAVWTAKLLYFIPIVIDIVNDVCDRDKWSNQSHQCAGCVACVTRMNISSSSYERVCVCAWWRWLLTRSKWNRNRNVKHIDLFSFNVIIATNWTEPKIHFSHSCIRTFISFNSTHHQPIRTQVDKTRIRIHLRRSTRMSPLLFFSRQLVDILSGMYLYVSINVSGPYKYWREIKQETKNVKKKKQYINVLTKHVTLMSARRLFLFHSVTLFSTEWFGENSTKNCFCFTQFYADSCEQWVTLNWNETEKKWKSLERMHYVWSLISIIRCDFMYTHTQHHRHH